METGTITSTRKAKRVPPKSVVDFGGYVKIVHWVDGRVFTTIPMVDAMTIMARSARWDDAHATEDVRSIHPYDILGGILPNVPVIFVKGN